MDVFPDDKSEKIIPELKKTAKCPKCGKDTLKMEFSKGEIRCSSCGFEERYPVLE